MSSPFRKIILNRVPVIQCWEPKLSTISAVTEVLDSKHEIYEVKIDNADPAKPRKRAVLIVLEEP